MIKSVELDEVAAQRVLDAVAKANHLTSDTIKYTRRGRDSISGARHVVFWILRTEYNYTLESIGDFLGRDHSTVALGVKKVNDILKLPLHSSAQKKFIARLNRLLKGMKPMV